MSAKFRIREIEGQEYIYDPIRKKEVLLTPEEWVRQHNIFYLTHELDYPPSLISVEKEILVNGQHKRYDILVYKEGKPWMIIECKREEVELDRNILQQVLSYASVLQIPFVALSNGRSSKHYSVINDRWDNGFPPYKS